MLVCVRKQQRQRRSGSEYNQSHYQCSYVYSICDFNVSIYNFKSCNRCHHRQNYLLSCTSIAEEWSTFLQQFANSSRDTLWHRQVFRHVIGPLFACLHTRQWLPSRERQPQRNNITQNFVHYTQTSQLLPIIDYARLPPVMPRTDAHNSTTC